MGKFIDEVGATRHAMSDKELDDPYKRLENFIADCTRSEVDANRDALNKVQRMRETKNNINRRGKPRRKKKNKK